MQPRMTVQVVSDTHTTHEHTETHTPPRDVRFVCACAHLYCYMIYDPRYNKPPLQLRDRASSLRACVHPPLTDTAAGRPHPRPRRT